MMNSTFPTSARLTLEVRPPCPTARHIVPAWLEEVRQLRGRAFYDAGRRPYFRLPDGSFRDPEPSDPDCYHVIARASGSAVGCSRVLPVTSPRSFTFGAIGKSRLAAILRDLDVPPEQVCEGSRWTVAPEHRGTLGPRLVGAAMALSRWLSFRVGTVLACTCSKQDFLLSRLGARPVPNVPLLPSTFSDDQFRLMFFDLQSPLPIMAQRMDQAAADLNLTAAPNRAA
jgi:hypothetical protein